MLVLVGCSSTVVLEPPAPTPEAAAVCAALMPNLPGVIEGQQRRQTSDQTLTAAWGKPPITLRCGVARPAAMTPSAQCYEVDGVGWLAEQAEGGYLFTTFGREAFVEVGVPSTYSPEANVLIDLAPAITAHDPVVEPCQ